MDLVGSCRHRLIKVNVVVALAIAAISPAVADAAPEPVTPAAVPAGVPGFGRAWELVTPGPSGSSMLVGASAVTTDGGRVLTTDTGPLPGATERSLLTFSLASRGADGWSRKSLAFPDQASLGKLDSIAQGPAALTPDMSASLWTNSLPLQVGETFRNVGVFRSLPSGGYTKVAEVGSFGQVLASSDDLQRFIFSSERHLLPSDAGRTEGMSVYELDGSTLRQLDLDSSGSLLSECGSTAPIWAGAITKDLNRVYLYSQGSPCAGWSDLYLRQGTTTTKISASRCTRVDCFDTVGDAEPITVTPSGGSIFFTTMRQLTDDDTNEITDLYRYDVAGDALTLISYQPAPGDYFGTYNEAVQVSPDGKRGYFEAVGQLIDGEGRNHEEGANLYYFDEEGLHFVAPAGQQLRVSADARFAYLATDVAMDPADLDSRGDIYRYDAEAGSMQLLTPGNGEFDAALGTLTGLTISPLAEGGRRAFITTLEPLLPADRNNAEDVYEWANGSLALVSAGEPGHTSSFGRVTPDGGTVLFNTTSTLVGRDRDGGDLDLYAARVGGGFPEPSPPPVCEGAACRPWSGQKVATDAPRSSQPGQIRLRKLDRETLRRAAATGRLALLAEVPQAGRLSAVAKAKIGKIAAGTVSVREAGPVRLQLQLSREARGVLAKGGALKVRLGLSLSGLAKQQKTSFKLKGQR